MPSRASSEMLFSGIPHSPKPPLISVMPSVTSKSAAWASENTLDGEGMVVSLAVLGEHHDYSRQWRQASSSSDFPSRSIHKYLLQGAQRFR